MSAVEEPGWDKPACGRCDPRTRMLTRVADGLWERCPTCHPDWNYHPDINDMRTAPVGRERQDEVIRQMRFRFPLLRLVPPEELRQLMRHFFDKGWFAVDVLHALDHDPEGNLVTYGKPGGTASAGQVAKWVQRRLETWRDTWKEVLPSRSQMAVALRETALAQAAAVRINWEELEARRVPPVESVGHSLALREARVAAGLARQRVREADNRELAARAARIQELREESARRQELLDALSDFANRRSAVE